MLVKENPIDFAGDPLCVRLQKIVRQEAHYHDNAIEILFCVKGSVSLRSSHRHVALRAGDVFSMDPGDIHCVYADTDNLVLLLHLNIDHHFCPKDLISTCFLACETQYMNSLQTGAMYRVKDLMLSLALRAFASEPPSIEMPDLSHAARELLNTLIRHFDWLSFIWDPIGENTLLKERFRRTIQYCLSNYMEKITLSMLAEREHINKNYFSVFLKHTSFNGFNSMLNFIRCDAAERMLLTTEESVVKISNTCGFSDPKYFFKHFKDWWGMTPAKLKGWYRDYQKQPAEVTILSVSDSYLAIKDYLCQYQIERTFSI